MPSPLGMSSCHWPLYSPMRPSPEGSNSPYSFQYFKTPNYRELLSFLNSGDYQVCIYGHSCGLSDRIMLNEIFENENCKSIKIYYYSDDDFTNKTMEISRHFNSNQVMRQKIVQKSKDDLIPQVKEME